ncbi:Uncharacterized protein Fot_26994 [Forsythia ovata]|uniref:Uncharacterized protein n=1 Tax=Forsythia ovata TaxID=205694 RepID=A0ABD1UDL2_9LAMI
MGNLDNIAGRLGGIFGKDMDTEESTKQMLRPLRNSRRKEGKTVKGVQFQSLEKSAVWIDNEDSRIKIAPIISFGLAMEKQNSSNQVVKHQSPLAPRLPPMNFIEAVPKA